MSVATERKSSIRQWALIGAEQRLVQLAEEAAAIHRAFPELRQRGGGGGHLPGPFAKPGHGSARRRKRTMSADARRRISEAQKARWARQKAGGKKK
jgi:hypothetical protein